jgi:hypothetical protein
MDEVSAIQAMIRKFDHKKPCPIVISEVWLSSVKKVV